MRETYNLTLVGNDGQNIELKLRLNILAQMELEKKYCKNKNDMLMETIIYSSFKPTVMVDVLNAALNYKGNDNSIKSGAELYELLVDNGYAGLKDWMELISNIALISGIINKDIKEAMLKNADKSQQAMLASDEDEEKN
jgi:hypothetical protein